MLINTLYFNSNSNLQAYNSTKTTVNNSSIQTYIDIIVIDANSNTTFPTLHRHTT